MDDECGEKLWTDLEHQRPFIYIGAVPFKGDSSDPKMFLKYLKEDRVIDGVEGAAQVEEDQDTGIPAMVHVEHWQHESRYCFDYILHVFCEIIWTNSWALRNTAWHESDDSLEVTLI